MAELPLPSFATLEKISGWLTEQASAYIRVLADPEAYFADVLATAADPLERSIKFFSFVVAVCFLLVAPINRVLFRLNIFDVSNIIALTVPFVLSALVVGFSTYCFSKLFGGKGGLRHSLAAMFFASAFLPLIYLTQFPLMLDVKVRAVVLSDNILNPSPPSLTGILGIILMCVVLTYTIVKLVPLIKVVHSVGSIRATSILLGAGLMEQIYEYFVWLPLFGETVRLATQP